MLCSAVVSWFSTSCIPTCVINHSSTGTNSSEGTLGSHHNIVFQICHAPGHSALNYPNRYTPKSSLVLPAYASMLFPFMNMFSTLTKLWPLVGHLVTVTYFINPFILVMLWLKLEMVRCFQLLTLAPLSLPLVIVL